MRIDDWNWRKSETDSLKRIGRANNTLYAVSVTQFYV